MTIVGALMVGALILGMGAMLIPLPMYAATGSLRVERGPREVTLSAIDGGAMMTIGMLLCFAVPLAYAVGGLIAAVIVGAISIAGLGSCRLELRVTPAGTQVSRHVLIVPWSRRRHAAAASVSVEGWGDDMDPTCLAVVFADPAENFELAYEDAAHAGWCEAIAARFNAAVAGLETDAR